MSDTESDDDTEMPGLLDPESDDGSDFEDVIAKPVSFPRPAFQRPQPNFAVPTSANKFRPEQQAKKGAKIKDRPNPSGQEGDRNKPMDFRIQIADFEHEQLSTLEQTTAAGQSKDIEVVKKAITAAKGLECAAEPPWVNARLLPHILWPFWSQN